MERESNGLKQRCWAQIPHPRCTVTPISLWRPVELLGEQFENTCSRYTVLNLHVSFLKLYLNLAWTWFQTFIPSDYQKHNCIQSQIKSFQVIISQVLEPSVAPFKQEFQGATVTLVEKVIMLAIIIYWAAICIYYNVNYYIVIGTSPFIYVLQVKCSLHTYGSFNCYVCLNWLGHSKMQLYSSPNLVL